MAEKDSNVVRTGTGTSEADSPHYVEGVTIPRPDGFIYKGFKLFPGTKQIWYASPKAQLLMVSFVCFLCPGLYNALNGLGGGGQLNPHVQANASTATYAVFAIVGFFSGSFANKLGIRITLAIGGFGYSLYSASFLAYNHTKNEGFVTFAGALLGLCAGLLWTAQGAIMMAYPLEKSKGRYISVFWIIFNAGGVLGALIVLVQNLNNPSGTVNDGTYIAFIVLMFAGAILALTLVNADKVIREDGSKVIVMKEPTWQSEFYGLWECIQLQPWVVLLFPMFFASNIFYTYQQNGVNGAHFNLQARSLNSLLYWLAQILGAIVYGTALDYSGIRRSVRSKIALVTLIILTFVIWGGGYAFEKDQPPRSVTIQQDYEAQKIAYTELRYIGPAFLYIFYGFYDACWQASIYWWIGALSNSGRKTANMAGFYKGIQSGGAAVFWALDGQGVSYRTLYAATFALCAASIFIAAPVIWLRIKDTTDIEEDLKFSDGTIEEVAPTAVLQEKRAAIENHV
ncbi:MFS general substrate transporter [Xylaria bambusicola]|uniref:MFS general substrate transporter n=1 Tax=Xylaria bambusicola TaxID=326684 RepID=UPI00200727B3|nr:MFS general substrate transporter [Xylaria bambusicola]KAI0517398.1 MFS general substrate transporter [Xylaria bambusicola]